MNKQDFQRIIKQGEFQNLINCFGLLEWIYPSDISSIDEKNTFAKEIRREFSGAMICDDILQTKEIMDIGWSKISDEEERKQFFSATGSVEKLLHNYSIRINGKKYFPFNIIYDNDLRIGNGYLSEEEDIEERGKELRSIVAARLTTIKQVSINKYCNGENSKILRCWIMSFYYLRLIDAEFDILYSFALFNRKQPWGHRLELWNEAYAKWKNDLEPYLKAISPHFQSPDFKVLLELELPIKHAYTAQYLFVIHTLLQKELFVFWTEEVLDKFCDDSDYLFKRISELEEIERRTDLLDEEYMEYKSRGWIIPEDVYWPVELRKNYIEANSRKIERQRKHWKEILSKHS